MSESLFILLCSVPTVSPSHGGFVKVSVWHEPAKLAHSFLVCSCDYFCLYVPLNFTSFHKSSCQLSIFQLCSSSLTSALLVLLTIYLFMKVSFNPDIIPSGQLGSKHQLTIMLVMSVCYPFARNWPHLIDFLYVRLGTLHKIDKNSSAIVSESKRIADFNILTCLCPSGVVVAIASNDSSIKMYEVANGQVSRGMCVYYHGISFPLPHIGQSTQ